MKRRRLAAPWKRGELMRDLRIEKNTTGSSAADRRINLSGARSDAFGQP